MAKRELNPANLVRNQKIRRVVIEALYRYGVGEDDIITLMDIIGARPATTRRDLKEIRLSCGEQKERFGEILLSLATLTAYERLYDMERGESVLLKEALELFVDKERLVEFSYGALWFALDTSNISVEDVVRDYVWDETLRGFLKESGGHEAVPRNDGELREALTNTVRRLTQDNMNEDQDKPTGIEEVIEKKGWGKTPQAEG